MVDSGIFVPKYHPEVDQIQTRNDFLTKTLRLINQLTLQQFSPSYNLRPLISNPMNDFKITLNSRHERFLSRLLPKGYSFQPYKVRKNMNDYPYKEFDKRYKRTESIILSKRESVMHDSFEPSEKSYREKSDVPSIQKDNYTPFQSDLLWLVRKLKRHDCSQPFRAPVDPKALQVPDYFDIVLEPIDLKTIEQQIKADHYRHMSEFQRDIYKMMMNSYKYNQKATIVYNKTIQFEQFFSDTMKQWQRIKEEEQVQLKDDKDEVKEEMVEENAVMEMRNEEFQQKMESLNLQNFRETISVVVEPVKIPVVLQVEPVSEKKQTQEIKEIKESKPAKTSAKTSAQIGFERPRVSEKKLSKDQLLLIKQLNAAQSRELKPEPEPQPSPEPEFEPEPEPQFPFQQIKQEESDFFIEDFLSEPPRQPEPVAVSAGVNMQDTLPKQECLLDQQAEPKKEEVEINNDFGDELENETVKEQNFSEGYNEFVVGNKIRNIEVQKEITSLLKKLNEYPLTKQKKNKLVSKFTNLDQNMTQTDKKRLSEKISKLDENDIECVIRILTRGKNQILKQEEFQIDLDKADSKVLREIQNFIAIRDNPALMPIENGALTPIIQSLELIKIPKKARKQDKKQLKKKLSRKNSNNDESFSINPPQVKKKKPQKPHKKNFKGDQQSSINADINSMNDEKSSSSSYRPEALHSGRPATAPNIQKHLQTEKNIQPVIEEKQKAPQEEKKKEEIKVESSRYDPSQIFINPHQSPCNQTDYHVDLKDDYDIDQFFAISQKNLGHDHDDDGVFTSGRKKRHTLDQLDQFNDLDFNLGKSNLKDYGEDEIQEISMEQRADLQGDEDEFY